jgi:hypothetical protein
VLETPRHQLALYAAGALLVLLLGALYLGREDGAVSSAPPPGAGGGAPAIDADRFEPSRRLP